MYSLTELYVAVEYMNSLKFRHNVKSLVIHIPFNIYIYIYNMSFYKKIPIVDFLNPNHNEVSCRISDPDTIIHKKLDMYVRNY